MENIDLLDPFQGVLLPLGDWVAEALAWLVANFRDYFQALKQPIDMVLSALESGLKGIPPLLLIAGLFLLAWQVAGLGTSIFVLACLLGIGVIGAWVNAMTTLAIVLTSVVFCCVIGIPLGTMIAQSNKAERVFRPVLDFLQTIPSFVYLVPIVMLFGIGNVPGVIVTIIYAIAPVIRLTNLGIRQVRSDLVEASTAFGGSRLQTLVKIQLPLARPAIMTGVNQTVMMSLSMSVIASMISVTGLGQMVLRGIGRLDMSLATTGGLGIVLTAMVVDRISQGFGKTQRERGRKHWSEVGPVGVIRRTFLSGRNGHAPRINLQAPQEEQQV